MAEEAGAKPKDSVRIVSGRGPAYPSISLREAVLRATQIRDANAARAVLSPETIFRIWGFKGASGASRPILASVGYYGLFEYIGRGDDRKAKLSELAHRIVFDKLPDSLGRVRSIQEAALKPQIFARLAGDLGLPPPADVVVEHHLTLHCGFSEGAARQALDAYKDTLEFSGLNKASNMPAKVGPDDDLTQVPEVGDLVHVEVGGAFVHEKPVRVRGVQEHGGLKWVFIEGSETGVPVNAISVVEHATKAQPLAAPISLLERVPPPRADAPPLRGPDNLEEIVQGRAAADARFYVTASRQLTAKELGKVIRMLEAQRDILAEDEGGGGFD